MTDADGGFVFNGAVPGVYELGARSRGTGANTPFVRIDLPSPDSERLGIRLELGPLETVSGRIMSGGVPVAGAQVYTMGMGAGSREGTSGVTDLDGRFEVRIAADGTRALFVVMAPGRPLKAFERSLESDLTFDLPQTGGALELHLPSGPSGLGLFQNGVPLPLPLALSWARTHGLVLKEGAPITIPDVDVAHYRVCRPPTSSEPRCAEGRVVPGGTLKLEMAAIQ